MRSGYQTAILIGVIALYSVAFVIPAANPYFDPVDRELHPWPGYTVFYLGWQLLTERGYWEQDNPFIYFQIAAVTGWMANPAIWLGFATAYLRRWWWVRLFGGIGAGLSLSLLTVPLFTDALAGEVGYWAWTASAIGLFIVGWCRRRTQVATEAKRPSFQSNPGLFETVRWTKASRAAIGPRKNPEPRPAPHRPKIMTHFPAKCVMINSKLPLSGPSGAEAFCGRSVRLA